MSALPERNIPLAAGDPTAMTQQLAGVRLLSYYLAEFRFAPTLAKNEDAERAAMVFASVGLPRPAAVIPLVSDSVTFVGLDEPSSSRMEMATWDPLAGDYVYLASQGYSEWDGWYGTGVMTFDTISRSYSERVPACGMSVYSNHVPYDPYTDYYPPKTHPFQPTLMYGCGSVSLWSE